MRQYHALLREVLLGDVQFDPRTEEYVLGVTGAQSRYDLREGFPLVTTREIFPRLAFEELFWKMRGERNVKPLVDRNVHYWTANAFDHHIKRNGLRDKFPKHSSQWRAKFEEYKERLTSDPEFAVHAGDLGPVYGYQWRHGFERGGAKIDQLQKLLDGLREKPGSRYHVLCAWNPEDLPDMALGPCPFWHQFSVYGKRLDMAGVQRSCDVYLGVPYNIAQDAALMHIVAGESGLEPGIFSHHYMNVHAYLGVQPRADFWTNPTNVREFQKRFRDAGEGTGFMALRDWYAQNAPPESAGNERKDHVPFILTQLSREPKSLPILEARRFPLFDLIQKPAKEIFVVRDYDPDKWDAKAVMAA